MNISEVSSILVLASLVAVPVLANRRGRRWWAWMIPTIFFGPFMLIPVLLIRNAPKAREFDTPVESSESKVIEYQPLVINKNSSSATSPNVEIESKGYVYVVTNPSLPHNLVKIGFTDRDPSERLKELDQAGLPTEYVEHYRIRTANPRELEKRLHVHFADKRFREDKEFFTVTPPEVYEVLLKWGVDPLEI
jgi:hypothetical protein